MNLGFQFQLLYLIVCTATSTLAVELIQKSCAPGPGVPVLQTLGISSINVEGCEEEPCIFYKGQIYSFDFGLFTDFGWTPTSTLNIVVIVNTRVGKVTLVDDDMCKRYSKTLSCSEIESGKKITVTDTELIYEVYPSFAGDSRIIIKHNGEPAFCTEVNVVVKSKPVTVDRLKKRVKAENEMRGETTDKLRNKIASTL